MLLSSIRAIRTESTNTPAFLSAYLKRGQSNCKDDPFAVEHHYVPRSDTRGSRKDIDVKAEKPLCRQQRDGYTHLL